MPLPPINVAGKVWFAHRHKAAGHSVAAELNDIVAGGCASLTCCTTQHAELAQLRDWLTLAESRRRRNGGREFT